MSQESLNPVNSWTDQLGSVRQWVLPATMILALIVGIHGTIHILPTGGGRHHVSTQAVLMVLWGITTLFIVGGLTVLGRAYSSLVSNLQTGPKLELGILPEDERHLVELIRDTPGITQVEVVARSDFSDAKVSQTLTTLRERGLIYREPQGRTYRLYPGTVLGESPREP